MVYSSILLMLFGIIIERGTNPYIAFYGPYDASACFRTLKIILKSMCEHPSLSQFKLQGHMHIYGSAAV